MSALEDPLPGIADGDLPRIYLACPLTGVTARDRRQLCSDVEVVKAAIERATGLDKLDDEAWPVAVYAPIEQTAPWGNDGLSPTQVYRRNLSEVHDADALIVLAERGGSAGVGQEIEWAARLGLPVSYLSASGDVSRQIAGIPGFVTAQSFNSDPRTLSLHVTNFLRLWKPAITDGPRRRRSRTFRYEPTTLRLRGAWQTCPNRTNVAAQVRVNIEYLELALSDPRYLASMATETLIELAHHLRVPLTGLEPVPTFVIPVTSLRPLMAAASEEGWDDTTVQRLLYEGRDRISRIAPVDLQTMAGWRTLHRELFHDE